MAFQLGTDGLLGFKNTLALIRDGKYAEAADAMLASKWATQTPLRAARLSAQMRTGAWQFAEGA
jgi:lysozyme